MQVGKINNFIINKTQQNQQSNYTNRINNNIGDIVSFGSKKVDLTKTKELAEKAIELIHIRRNALTSTMHKNPSKEITVDIPHNLPLASLYDCIITVKSGKALGIFGYNSKTNSIGRLFNYKGKTSAQMGYISDPKLLERYHNSIQGYLQAVLDTNK